MHRLMGVAALALALASAGCGGEKTYRVTGTITWNGEPVQDGQIIFEAEDGQTQPAASKFTKDGRFEVRAAAGAKRVRIYGQRSKGFNRVMNQETFESYVPKEYNAKSELRFQVMPTDDNVC